MAPSSHDDWSGFDSIDAARTRIDEDISRIEAQLQELHKLRSRRNALAPVFRLPVEVLSQIMMDHQELVFKTCLYNPQSQHNRLVLWIAISQVSHHWRSVALECPHLWTTISIPHMSHRWIEETARRSRRSRLSLLITYPIHSAYWAKVHCSMVKEISRVSSLTFSGDPTNWTFFFALKLSSAPLKCLEMFNFNKDWSPSIRLQHLRLQRSKFLRALISNDLLSLTLEHLESKSMPSLADLYSALSSLTVLRYLSLKNVLSHCTGTMDMTLNLALPSLSTLVLFDEPERSCAHFLSQLTSPQLEYLTVSLDKSVPTALALLSDAMPRTLSTAPKLNRYTSTNIYLKMSNMGVGHLVLANYRDYKFSLSWVTRVAAMDALPTSLLSSLSLKEVNYLGLSWDIFPDTLRTLSSCSPALANTKILALYKSPLSAALNHAIPPCRCTEEVGVKSLLRELDSPLDSSSIHVCASCKDYLASTFPKLHDLILELPSPLWEGSPELPVLSRFVKHRIVCGHPLMSVRVTCPAIQISQGIQRQLESLEKSVDVEVYVDGKKWLWSVV
ncbi:hypothetical protein AX16_009956 [Volvariella volvacea WC 439]|nr:hypothetical protein AX16_009956 [Volvariella volvacea WC 439]